MQEVQNNLPTESNLEQKPTKEVIKQVLMFFTESEHIQLRLATIHAKTNIRQFVKQCALEKSSAILEQVNAQNSEHQAPA
jgi:hypothetical protein